MTDSVKYGLSKLFEANKLTDKQTEVAYKLFEEGWFGNFAQLIEASKII